MVLIVVGPDKLPQFARSAGRLYGQVRRTADELRRSLVLEADRQDAEKRYEEMMARRRRAEEERRKAQEANPGVEAQEEHLPGAPAPADTLALGASDAHAAPVEHDQDLQSLLDDPAGPYAAGRSLDQAIHEPGTGVLTAADGSPLSTQGDRAPEDLPFATPAAPQQRVSGAPAPDLPPGVTAEEWAELPEHIRSMLRQRAGGGQG